MQTTSHQTTNASAAKLAEHTPGPWDTDIVEAIEIIDSEGVNSGLKNDTRISGAVVYINHGSGKGGQICSLPHDPYDGLDLHDIEYQANARLIAAAPELMMALREIESRCGDMAYYKSIKQIAFAAISSALGL